jgi:hypothetical protein
MTEKEEKGKHDDYEIGFCDVVVIGVVAGRNFIIATTINRGE